MADDNQIIVADEPTTHPYLFNSTEILYPITWDESFAEIENVQQSEAGTDIVSVRRSDKLSVSASFKVNTTWLTTLKSFKSLDSFTLSRYDGTTEGYDTRTVRMRNFSQKRIRWSETAVDGSLWEVSFNLEEF